MRGSRFADLHLHTLFSDSTYTPKELVLKALELDLACIAVVDHDTVNGIEPTEKFAKLKKIEVLTGIELTAEYNGIEIHILGYLIDYKRKELTEKLDFLKKVRIERIYKILDKLKNMGIKLKPDTVFKIAKQGTVTRLHIARAMVNEGLINSTQEAFLKYIGDSCPCYIAGFRFSPYEAIKLIKNVGGIPVLAHPYSLNKDELIPQFIEYGLMGLEIYYPEHTQSMVNFYLNLAKKYDLLITGGSDCHGEAKSKVTIGLIKIPYDLVEKLKEAKINLR